MTVIPLRAYVEFSHVPTPVLVDLQQEYVTPQRELALANANAALDKCREALGHVRLRGFPVAFMRWIGCSAYFNTAAPFVRWIGDFEPAGANMVFERDRPSCFASEPFADLISPDRSPIVIAGFAGEAACLSTTIDAHHRHKKVIYLSDASASHPLGEMSGPETHRAVETLANLYGVTMTTAEWIDATSSSRARNSLHHG